MATCNDEETVMIETSSGPRRVPKKFVVFAPKVQEKVTIRTKDGRSIPLVLKSLPVVFKKNVFNADKKTIRLQRLGEPTEVCDEPMEFPMRSNGRTPRPCPHCDKRFYQPTKLAKHVERAHVERDLTCPVCGAHFRFQTLYAAHMKTHSIDKKYECQYCGQKIASRRVLENHVRRHTGDYQHKCDECGKEFYSGIAFSHHVQAEHEGIRYPCEVCGSVLKSKRYYKDHMGMHRKTDPKTYECDVCHKYYSTKSALNGHKRIHSDVRYVCHVCGKKSIQKGAHNVHMKMHTGEKAFICEWCGKDFLRKDVLATHVRRAHGVGHIPCIRCNAVFRTDYQLMVHLHTHTDIDKPYPCEICGQRFIDLNFLRSHVNKVHIAPDNKMAAPPKFKRRTINGKTAYVCYICDDILPTLTQMREHFQEHQVEVDEPIVYEETYQCQYCNATYANIDEIEEHITQHEAAGDVIQYQPVE